MKNDGDTKQIRWRTCFKSRIHVNHDRGSRGGDRVIFVDDIVRILGLAIIYWGQSAVVVLYVVFIEDVRSLTGGVEVTPLTCSNPSLRVPMVQYTANLTPESCNPQRSTRTDLVLESHCKGFRIEVRP